MPIVSIEVTNSFTQEEEIALMKSVYSALKEVFELSDDAINIRLFVCQSSLSSHLAFEKQLENQFH